MIARGRETRNERLGNLHGHHDTASVETGNPFVHSQRSTRTLSFWEDIILEAIELSK